MKISFVLDNFGGGGKEHRCLQLIQGLLSLSNYEIQIILVDGVIAYKELRDCNVSLDIIYRKEKKLGHFDTFCRISKALSQFNPDIVQAWGMMSAFYVLPVSLTHRFIFLPSYVADVISPATFSTKCINWLCNVLCPKIVGNSLAGLTAYSVPPSKAVCIYNGFNELRYTHLVDKQNKKRELTIKTPYVVSMVATFSKYKDWDCFFKAAALICSTRTDISFLAVGAGPMFEQYRSEIGNLCIDNIKLLGRRDDVDEILQITDVSVLCSNTQYREGLSNTIMESMAWGIPVIATTGGGTPELVVDGKNGLLIRDQNPDVLSKMITALIDDNNMRLNISTSAKNTIKSGFLLSDMTENYDKLYESLIKQ